LSILFFFLTKTKRLLLLRLIAILYLLAISLQGYTQHDISPNSVWKNMPFQGVKFQQTDSGLYIYQELTGICRLKTYSHYFIPIQPVVTRVEQQNNLPPIKHTPFLVVHGNIAYDYFYRSKIDTPVSQQDLQQHTERVYLDLMIKGKYPVKLNFTSRQSNSPYFRNFADVNLNFDRYNYTQATKQAILDKLKMKIPEVAYPNLSKAEAELQKYKDEYAKTKAWLEDPGTLQKIVEQKEKWYYQQLKAKEDSISAALSGIANNKKTDSLRLLVNKNESIIKKIKDSVVDKGNNKVDSLTAFYESEKKRLDSLEKKIVIYKSKADSVRMDVVADAASLRNKIYNATSEKELRKLAKENGIDLEKRTWMEKQLAAVKSLGIGRSMLDYTELTAQNITVTGINVEYNPSYYAAFAAGKIDYRFRDFYNKTARRNNQYVVMGRLGIGDKDNKALILSYFTGRKSTADFGISDSANSSVNIMGYSLEAIYKKDENTFLSAEFAKSTKPVTGNLRESKQTGALLNFSDMSNMGINIKGQTIIPQTHTNISGFFRKTGENFLSFSLFSYNTNQVAWLMRADQTFLRDRITFTTMLRRNDFTNPFTDKTYKTSTIFKTVILNVRFPKYPTISIGYYPGTQLYMVDKETIRESAYYILNASCVYSYFLKGLSMNSTVVYNKYMTEATDSGFIAYKGVNYYASQSVLLRKLQLQGGFAYTQQPKLVYHTLEASGNYAIKNWLRLGLGTKYNNINGGKDCWGASMLLRMALKQFGVIQLQYEKSYLPAINQALYPVEIGRLSYYKNF